VGLNQPPTADSHPGGRAAGIWDPSGARRPTGVITMIVSENPRRDKRPRRLIGERERRGQPTARLLGQCHGSPTCGRRSAGDATFSWVAQHLQTTAAALREQSRHVHAMIRQPHLARRQWRSTPLCVKHEVYLTRHWHPRATLAATSCRRHLWQGNRRSARYWR
jgi:hypothetical protein